MATNIFISYRKDDSRWNTELLYEKLSKYFSEKLLFKDFNTIKAGENYRESISHALNKCKVLLVVMGKNWLNIKDENGLSRLQNPEDLVRIEIATALGRNIRVIPVLFDNIKMPSQDMLPEDLRQLTLRQFVSVSETNFDYDILHLAEAIKNKRIREDDSKINLARILRYRILLTTISFILLSAFISGISGIHILQSQYVIIAGLTSLIISLLISSLLKKRVRNTIKSRMQVTSICLFILFALSVAFHIYYFQKHTFVYSGFKGQKSYYIKGSSYTPLGNALKKAHANMIDADILKKLLGGPGEASRLWTPDSITSARFTILSSYTIAIIFSGLFISVLLELLAMKYKPDE